MANFSLESLRNEMISKAKRQAKKNDMGFVPSLPMSSRFQFTGYGEDGKLQPDMPTQMLQTNRGPRMIHEGELSAVGPDGKLTVIPAGASQDMLRMAEQAYGVRGYQTGTGTNQPTITRDPNWIDPTGGVQDDPTRMHLNLVEGTTTSSLGTAARQAFTSSPQNVTWTPTPSAARSSQSSTGLLPGATQPTGVGVQASPRSAQYQGYFDQALRSTADLARGQSKLQETIANQGREQLAGTQAAGQSALGQRMAQTGTTGGLARTETAMLGREQGAQTAQLEGQLSESKLAAAERATGELAGLAQTGLTREDNLRAEELARTSGDFKIQWDNYQQLLKEAEQTGNYEPVRAQWASMKGNPAFAQWMPASEPDFEGLRTTTQSTRNNVMTGEIADIMEQNAGDKEYAYGLVKEKVRNYLKANGQDSSDGAVRTYFDSVWGEQNLSPIDRGFRTLMNTTSLSQYFDTDIERSAVQESISDLWLNGGLYEKDGQILTDATKIMQIWKSPKYEHIFLHNKDGSLNGITQPQYNAREAYITAQGDGYIMPLSEFKTAYDDAIIAWNSESPGIRATVWGGDIGKFVNARIADASKTSEAKSTNKYSSSALNGKSLSTTWLENNAAALGNITVGATNTLGDASLFNEWLRTAGSKYAVDDNLGLNTAEAMDSYKSWAEEALKPGGLKNPNTIDSAGFDGLIDSDGKYSWTGRGSWSSLTAGNYVEFKQPSWWGTAPGTSAGEQVPAGKYVVRKAKDGSIYFESTTVPPKYYYSIKNRDNTGVYGVVSNTPPA